MRIVAIFRKNYPIFLGFPQDKLYLISRLYNIYLNFPKNINSVKLYGLYSVAIIHKTFCNISVIVCLNPYILFLFYFYFIYFLWFYFSFSFLFFLFSLFLGQWRYYNLRLGSCCNLDKDLSKDRENDQLVKYKDTRLYLQLYIAICQVYLF